MKAKWCNSNFAKMGDTRIVHIPYIKVSSDFLEFLSSIELIVRREQSPMLKELYTHKDIEVEYSKQLEMQL